MSRLLLLGLALVFLVGCDTEADRPLTLGERVAGTWAMDRVRDGGRTVTSDFEQTVGLVEFEFESVGCCAREALYRITITRPSGEVTEFEQRYRVNDNPETSDYFALFTGRPQEDILFVYELSPRFSELTLTVSGMSEALREELAVLGIDYPFRESVVFELERR